MAAGKEPEAVAANLLLQADPAGKEGVLELLLILGLVIIEHKPESGGEGVNVLDDPGVLRGLARRQIEREPDLQELQGLRGQPADPLKEDNLSLAPETFQLLTKEGDLEVSPTLLAQEPNVIIIIIIIRSARPAHQTARHRRV